MIFMLSLSLVSTLVFQLKRAQLTSFLSPRFENKSTRAYLRRFDEEMLNLEDLLESIATKVLINGVYNYSL